MDHLGVHAVNAVNELLDNKNCLEYFNGWKRSRQYDDVLILNMAKKKKVEKAKIEGYVLEVVPRYSEIDFKSHFRMTRSTVEVLMEFLPPVKASSTGRTGLQSSSRETVVLMSLWTMGNQESFRTIADRFGLGLGHAYREFIRFCIQLCSKKSEAIRWPRGEEAVRVMQEFNHLRPTSFPNVISCIDGTHISIAAPKVNKAAYYNRKQYASVLLQAACDAKLRFVDVFAGWPGSTHDARVWRNSALCQRILVDQTMIPAGAHILGDGAYPLCTYLLPPYKDNGHLTRKQKLFNRVLSSTRVVIEQAFGQLFCRFRRLKHLHMFNMKRISLVIVAGCILHNFCVNDGDPCNFVRTNDNDDWSDDELDDDILPRGAARKRNEIANILFDLMN